MTVEEYARRAHEATCDLLNALGESGMLEDSYTDTPGAVEVADVIDAESRLSSFRGSLATSARAERSSLLSFRLNNFGRRLG